MRCGLSARWTALTTSATGEHRVALDHVAVEIGQTNAPESRIVYVDNDPIVGSS
jgi:hypothetical protein